MKPVIRLISIAAVIILFQLAGYSQLSNMEEVEIQTSAQCPMCKESIEEMITFERGVRHALLNMETKIVSVRYNNRRTDVERLRRAITKLGYDADHLEGESEAYANLPACCKKPDDPNHVAH